MNTLIIILLVIGFYPVTTALLTICVAIMEAGKIPLTDADYEREKFPFTRRVISLLPTTYHNETKHWFCDWLLFMF